ncbi:MAG: hypothetical protein JNL57_07700 [Bacteroidetes bacterium]|nr:hypothetical protein [Bacteroidota bacterium]
MMEGVKMKKIVLAAGLMFAFVSCVQKSTTRDGEDDSVGAGRQVQQKTADTATGRRDATIIAAGTDLLIEEVKRPEMLLLGREVKVEYRKMMQEMPLLMRDVIEVAAAGKAALTGSPTIALLEKPAESGPTRLFIGMPVSKACKARDLSTITVAGGSYYKTMCNTEAGMGLSFHQRIQSILSGKGLKTGFPCLESYSDSRNDDMTTTLNKCTILYPKAP